MYRAVVGPVTPVKVGTSHGELEFNYRDVEVFDAAGTAVARFTCEDTPEDFDANVARAGFRRSGFDRETGNVLLEKAAAQGQRQVAAAPERSAGEAAASLVGNLMKLAWMAVLFIILVVVLFGCAAAIFGHH